MCNQRISFRTNIFQLRHLADTAYLTVRPTPEMSQYVGGIPSIFN